MPAKLLNARTAVLAAAPFCAALFLVTMAGQASLTSQGQAAGVAPGDQALRARRIAEQFEVQARVLTVFDRQGKVVTTVGERGIYEAPVFSPDRTRLAVIKTDLESDTEDLWVLDVATGKGTRITSNLTQREERVNSPVWSPNGSQLAYVALRGGSFGLYRKTSSGAGAEELLYQHPGRPNITDWSMDGRFLIFSTVDLSGGIFYALPLAGDGERKPTVIFRDKSQMQGGRLSPDGRFLSYRSNQSGRFELYVRPFDPSAGAQATAARPWQVSGEGGGAAFWRRDGKEINYVATDQGVMAAEVSTAPRFEFGKQRLLFRLSAAVPTGGASFSRDGQRVVIAVPHAPTLRQITIFDRQGKILSKLGEPGLYQNPAFSPDGTRVAVRRTDPRTNNVDIWTFDVASGKGTPVTNDASQDGTPIWSPDGRQVTYTSARGTFQSIYRKAWDGTGTAELLFQYTPGAFLQLSDWSADGKLLAFYDNCWGVLHVLPFNGDRVALERKAIDWLVDEYQNGYPQFSPDSRFIAYVSDEIRAGAFDIFIRPFDASKPEAGAGDAKAVQVPAAGARGMLYWPQGGHEIYYLTPDWEVMAVEVTTTPAFQAGAPRRLFRVPGPLFRNPGQWGNVSRDGQRFVFPISVPVSVVAR